jgi:hypothetical protein
VSGTRLVESIGGQSFLERAFVRWVLAAAATEGIAPYVVGQYPVMVDDHAYALDYLLVGSQVQVAIELDGFEFRSARKAFVYDRIRQNDLTGLGYAVLRFSYDAIRDHTARCVTQLQTVMRGDPMLKAYLIADPIVHIPHDMTPNPLTLATPAPRETPAPIEYFDLVCQHMDLRPLRDCQHEAIVALANYCRRGDINAACVMWVGAGKAALEIAAALAFTRSRVFMVRLRALEISVRGRSTSTPGVGNVYPCGEGLPRRPGSATAPNRHTRAGFRRRAQPAAHKQPELEQKPENITPGDLGTIADQIRQILTNGTGHSRKALFEAPSTKSRSPPTTPSGRSSDSPSAAPTTKSWPSTDQLSTRPSTRTNRFAHC